MSSAVHDLLRLLGDAPSRSAHDERRRLQALLTAIAPGTIPEEAWPLLDRLWAEESRGRSVVRAADLPRAAPGGWKVRVSLWRGDITTLSAHAIVNAANAALTGCYRPFHACVDNAIHTAAGPRLREECGRIMGERGRPEPTATATATAGYFLPARHVLHTVGPVVQADDPTEGDAALLERCYVACLEAAATLDAVRSVAFCSISTGVFGYPVRAAAPLAVAAVRRWLVRGGSVDHVVFVTYSDADHAVYGRAIEEAPHE